MVDRDCPGCGACLLLPSADYWPHVLCPECQVDADDAAEVGHG